MDVLSVRASRGFLVTDQGVEQVAADAAVVLFQLAVEVKHIHRLQIVGRVHPQVGEPFRRHRTQTSQGVVDMRDW